MKIEIEKSTIREWLIFSFRYMLGRSTIGVFGICEDIKKHIDLLNETDIKQIIGDIEYQKRHFNLGMECDKTTWLGLKDYLERKEG